MEDVPTRQARILRDRIGLGGDVADRAANGTAPEQRALWTAQHFDPIDIEQLQIEQTGVQVDLRFIDACGGRLAKRAGIAAGRQATQHELHALARAEVGHCQAGNHAARNRAD